MTSTIRQLIVKYWFVLFFGIVLAFMIMFGVSLNELWDAVRSLYVWQLAALLTVYVFLSGLNILLRKFLLFSLGENAQLKNLLLIHFTGMAAHYSTPAKLGFPVTVLLLKRLEDISYAVGTTMIFIELLVSMAVCGVIGVLGTFFYFSEGRFVIPCLALIAVFSCCVLIMRNAAVDENNQGRFSRAIMKVKDALELFSLKKLVTYTALRTVVQACAGVNLFLICFFFSADISYAQALVIGSSAFFLGALSMVPMGLGIREGSVIFYLARFGVEGANAISIVTVQRLISTGLGFILGLIFSGFLGIRNSIDAFSEKGGIAGE